MLEALRHDEDADVYYVVSAWGERADWLRNLRQTPEATLLVGDRRLEAVARPLAAAEGERELRRFVRRHPLPARLLLRILGRRLPAAEEGFRVLAEALVVVALRVRGTA